MTPLLIIKTANGFALLEYTAELPTVALPSLMCFAELDNSISYREDGALAAIKRHFTPPPALEVTDQMVA